MDLCWQSTSPSPAVTLLTPSLTSEDPLDYIAPSPVTQRASGCRLLLEEIPAIVGSNEITFLCPHGAITRLSEKLLFKDVLQGKVKSFLTQTGAVGTPAANDTDGSKFKAKSAYILACENTLAEIYSKLRGFNYSFSNAEALKKVDSVALAKVKAIKC